MGFHICKYCLEERSPNPETSSGDVTLRFSNGNIWMMPDMIVHYIRDHHWRPTELFIVDVLHREFLGGGRSQTRGMEHVVKIGYLDGPLMVGDVPEGFVQKLQSLMQQASEQGDRAQTKGLDLNNLR